MTREETRRKVYNTPRWVRLREWKLTRDPVCRCGVLATQVHHVEPIRSGGEAWEPSNLESVCFRCHQRRHEKPERRAWSVAVNELL